MRIAYICADPGIPVFGQKGCSIHVQEVIRALLGTALVLWYGTRLVIQDALSPGTVPVFLSYLKNAFKPVQNFAKYTGRLAKAAASGDRILTVLETEPEVQTRPGARPPPRCAAQSRSIIFTLPTRPSIPSCATLPSPHRAPWGTGGGGWPLGE